MEAYSPTHKATHFGYGVFLPDAVYLKYHPDDPIVGHLECLCRREAEIRREEARLAVNEKLEVEERARIGHTLRETHANR